MFGRFVTHIKEGRLYQAVEICRTTTDEALVFISVQKKKNALEVVEKSKHSDIKTLSEKTKKNSPFFVVINTAQVLTRIVPLPPGDDLTVVNAAFPNLKTEDFYYEWVPSGHHAMVSVCRKTHVHEVLRQCNEAGVTVSGFSLGISQISMIKAFIPGGVIMLPHTRITLNDNKDIETVEQQENHQPETYDINGISLESDYLPGFAAALSSVVKNRATHTNFGAVNTRLLHDLYNRRFFGFFLRSGLGFLLVLLLANVFAFNYYYKKTETLQQTLTVKSADKNQVLELSRRVEAKQKRVEAMLVSSSSKSSYYIDKIAEALPSSVLLDKIIYQPVIGQLKQDSEIAVERGVLIVSGASKDSDAFSHWVETLEQWDWAGQVGIRDYDYSNASTSSFVIQITLKNEQ
ncbi:MAG: hypothetical protein KDD04_01910 [Sinomicrobium sp.]|nr:hypothetical protein [Sinomicrobium sp.]